MRHKIFDRLGNFFANQVGFATPGSEKFSPKILNLLIFRLRVKKNLARVGKKYSSQSQVFP